jgi:hypothetical protein
VKKKEKTTKDTELNSKNSELATLISKIITKKREELNQSNIKEFENKTASGGQDERKTMSELFKLKLLLLSIRYLENDGDTTLASSVLDENTALTTIEDISSKAIQC